VEGGAGEEGVEMLVDVEVPAGRPAAWLVGLYHRGGAGDVSKNRCCRGVFEERTRGGGVVDDGGVARILGRE